MSEGVEVELGDGFAWLTPLSSGERGALLGALLGAAEGDPALIEVDTSGTHFTYVVPESIAQAAGYVDTPESEPEPEPKPRRRKTKAEKEAEEAEAE